MPTSFVKIESDSDLSGLASFESKGTIESTYFQACNFYKEKPNEGFLTFVKDLIEQNNRELDLNQCPGIEDLTTLSLLPVSFSLQFDNFFTSLYLQDINNRSDSIEIFSKMLETNKTLKTIFLSGRF